MKVNNYSLIVKTNTILVNNIKVVTFFILVALLFVPVLWELIKWWSATDDYSHGFFVIPISLYMVWHKREKLQDLRTKPSWIGLPILVAGAIIYLISFIAKFHALIHLSMLVIVLGLLLFVTGWRVTKELIFPLLFLLFMFPIPSSYYILLTNPLKLLTTKISMEIIYLMEIPVYREGNILFMASSQLEVTEACSGIRSLYSYLMLGCLFAMISKKLWGKIFLIAFTIPLALMINIIRVTITGILAHFFGDLIAQSFFHQFSGFILFISGFILLWLEYYIINYEIIIKR